VFNSNTPNQHSSPFWTSLTSLKLQPYSRQTVQHASWSQGHSTSLHHQAFWVNPTDFISQCTLCLTTPQVSGCQLSIPYYAAVHSVPPNSSEWECWEKIHINITTCSIGNWVWVSYEWLWVIEYGHLYRDNKIPSHIFGSRIYCRALI